MLQGLLYLFLFILVLLGISSLIQEVLLRIFVPKRNRKTLLILPIGEDVKQAEYILRGAEMYAKILGDRLCGHIIIVDCGMDTQTQAICAALCRDLDGMEVCTCEELQRILQKG